MTIRSSFSSVWLVALATALVSAIGTRTAVAQAPEVAGASVDGNWAARNLSMRRQGAPVEIVLDLSQSGESVRGMLRIGDAPSEPLEGTLRGDSLELRNQRGIRIVEGKRDGTALMVRLLAGDRVPRVVMENRIGSTARPIRFTRSS